MNEANEDINLIKQNIGLLWLVFAALHVLSLQTIIDLMLKFNIYSRWINSYERFIFSAYFLARGIMNIL